MPGEGVVRVCSLGMEKGRGGVLHNYSVHLAQKPMTANKPETDCTLSVFLAP